VYGSWLLWIVVENRNDRLRLDVFKVFLVFPADAVSGIGIKDNILDCSKTNAIKLCPLDGMEKDITSRNRD